MNSRPLSAPRPSFPRRRESRVSVHGPWIPAFAGMTSRGVRTLFSAIIFCSPSAIATEITWENLPPLPRPISGHFVGTHNGALIVAGGSNFDVSPFQGGEKQWYDRIYVLPPGADTWQSHSALPQATAYGASISTPDGLVCVGGSDGDRHYANALLLQWANGELVNQPLPDLPTPAAYCGGAAIGDVVYVFGGHAAPDDPAPFNKLWSLDLTNIETGWREIPDYLPGPGRILPVVAAQSGSLYVFSGASLRAEDDGALVRTYLADGYAFTPGSGWREAAPPPKPIVAAPAVAFGAGHIVLFSGDDGSLYEQTQSLGDDHPGFAADTLLYHTFTDAWANVGDAPFAYVTTGATVLDGNIVVPGGEDRPGHRSDRVFIGDVQTARSVLGPLDFGAIALYSVVLIGMGFYFARREHDTEAFFLGSRNVPWWAVGISIFGTSLSAITYLSIPATAFMGNWQTLTYNLTILAIAPIVVTFFVPYYLRTRITTAYEYLHNRFGLLLRIYGTIVFMLFQFGRVAIILCLPAIALSTTTGLDIQVCILLMGVLAIVYTVLGGIEAVIWSDVLQAAVLSLGALIAVSILMLNIDGGIPAALADGAAAGKLHAFDWTIAMMPSAFWVIVIGGMFTNLYPATADQTVVQRYLSTASAKEAKRAVWTNAWLALPVSFVFFGLGTMLWAFYRQHPEQMEPITQNDAILPLFIAQHFPTGLAGLIIAGVFAASMSSLDSSMNSFGTVIVNDYYRLLRPNVSDKHALFVARVMTFLFGAVGTGCALLIAAQNDATLFQRFIGLLGLVGGGLVGLIALGMWTERAHTLGAAIGVIVSAAAVIWANGQPQIPSELNALIGVTTCFAVGYLASRILPGQRRY
jgi:solute:Na+ symporter, SSS family